jgi:hypothetical protein
MDLYEFKKMCENMRYNCKINRNRCVEKLGQAKYDTHTSSLLANFLNRCICMEKLCEYLSMCCCDLENISNSCLSEYSNRCKQLNHILTNLKKDVGMSDGDKKYLRIDLFCELCKHKTIKIRQDKKSKTKKASRN